MEATTTPQGVNVIEPQVAAPQPQMQQAAPMAAPVQSSGGFFSNINPIEAVIAIGLVTFFCFGIYYFKTQTKTVNPAIKDLSEKIEKIDSDLAKVEENFMPTTA